MEIKDYVTGIQHVGIPTDDIERTVNFYTSIGFEVALRTRNEAAGEAVAFLQQRNLVIETYENHRAVGKAGAIDHIALDVSDIEKVFEFIRAGDYQLKDRQIQYLPFWENGVRYFNILGPNGETVEFSQML